MFYRLLLLFSLILLFMQQGFSYTINHPFKLSSSPNNLTDDPGLPLYLTPLIKSGDIRKAQQLSEVTLLNVSTWLKSYSGLITVNEKTNSNMFFWYFVAVHDPENAPVLIWLQGGPGASSLFGLFTENGPLSVEQDGSLLKRKYSWHLNHHLIYIDNPVGTGFSYTSSESGYARNEDQISENLYELMRQFYNLFPHLQSNGLYLSGESYAGKYVPAFAYKIHTKNNAPNQVFKINLKGLAIGNAWSDPIHQVNMGDYLFELGLIDEKLLQVFHDYEARGIQMIEDEDYLGAFALFDELLDGDMTNHGSIRTNATGITFPYNYLLQKQPENYLGQLISNATWRRAIHVGALKFNSNDNVEDNKVGQYLILDVMKSVAPWIEELLEQYVVVFYNGQLDLVCPYPQEVNHLKNLKFKDAEVYKNADRLIWKVDDEIAGYYKKGGNLIEVLVRDSGHMVPTDQPKWAFDLITRVTHGKYFDSKY